MKIEQRKVQGPEGNLRWAPSLHRVRSGWGEKIHKKNSQKLSPSVSLSSLLFFCVSLRSCLRDVFSFVFQIQLSCNTELYHWSIHHFKFLLRWDRTEEITYSPDVSIKNLSIRISSVSKFNIYCYLFSYKLADFSFFWKNQRSYLIPHFRTKVQFLVDNEVVQSFVVVQLLSHVQLLATPWTAAN